MSTEKASESLLSRLRLLQGEHSWLQTWIAGGTQVALFLSNICLILALSHVPPPTPGSQTLGSRCLSSRLYILMCSYH